MAATTFGRSTYSAYAADSHANLIEQIWSRKAFKHGLAINPLLAYMGTGDGSIIQVNKDFLKKAGDKITFHLRLLLYGDGQGDDGNLESNEEAMVFSDESVVIHERGHATAVNGLMTEQRTSIPLREEGKNAIGEWQGRAAAADIISALSGLNNTKSFAGQRTGAQAVDASSSGIDTVNAQAFYGRGTTPSMGKRIFYGGQTTAGTLTRKSGDAQLNSNDAYKFGTKVISYVKRMAEATIELTSGNVITPVRPIVVDGEPKYLMLIDQWQAYDLRLETAWQQAQREANVRGRDNPIFSGAMGEWDGVVIRPCHLMHIRYGENGTTASEFFYSSDDIVASGYYVARALFLGAQAGLLAYGKLPSWEEARPKYKGDMWGIGTRMIYGTKRPKYTGSDDNSRDFGCIAVDTNINPQ